MLLYLKIELTSTYLSTVKIPWGKYQLSNCPFTRIKCPCTGPYTLQKERFATVNRGSASNCTAYTFCKHTYPGYELHTYRKSTSLNLHKVLCQKLVCSQWHQIYTNFVMIVILLYWDPELFLLVAKKIGSGFCTSSLMVHTVSSSEHIFLQWLDFLPTILLQWSEDRVMLYRQGFCQEDLSQEE